MGKRVAAQEKNIEIIEINVKNIGFKKYKEPKNETEIVSDLKCSYLWTKKNSREGEIEVSVFFEFVPKVLFAGKITFQILVLGEAKHELEEDDKEFIFNATEQRIVSTASFLATICGDAICGTKFIFPPIFSEKKGK